MVDTAAQQPSCPPCFHFQDQFYDFNYHTHTNTYKERMVMFKFLPNIVTGSDTGLKDLPSSFGESYLERLCFCNLFLNIKIFLHGASSSNPNSLQSLASLLLQPPGASIGFHRWKAPNQLITLLSLQFSNNTSFLKFRSKTIGDFAVSLPSGWVFSPISLVFVVLFQIYSRKDSQI